VTSHRILIVDDDESLRTLLRLTLPAEDYDVIEAHDGAEALRMIETRHPDLVVLDWQMPSRSGADVLAGLRTSGRELPVIVLTAGGGDQRARAEALGANAFLTKPFSPLELLAEIERLLETD
jgi:DNA-binding response OmpR family regulator